MSEINLCHLIPYQQSTKHRKGENERHAINCHNFYDQHIYNSVILSVHSVILSVHSVILSVHFVNVEFHVSVCDYPAAHASRSCSPLWM